MHVLFVHSNFPAQFRCIAPRLAREYAWRCTFVTRNAEAPDVPGVERGGENGTGPIPQQLDPSRYLRPAW